MRKVNRFVFLQSEFTFCIAYLLFALHILFFTTGLDDDFSQGIERSVHAPMACYIDGLIPQTIPE